MPQPDEVTIKKPEYEVLYVAAAAAITYTEASDDETWQDLLKAVEKLKASGWGATD